LISRLQLRVLLLVLIVDRHKQDPALDSVEANVPSY